MEEQLYINYCIKFIEEKVKWGDSKDWVDFQYKELSELIYEKSHTSISINTLKRLFGRFKEHSQQNYKPQSDTKNALAVFLDYRDWSDLKKHVNSLRKDTENADKGSRQETESNKNKRISKFSLKKYFFKKSFFIFLGIAMITAVVASVSFYLVRHKANASNFAAKRFSVKVNRDKAPLTAIFTYDISNIRRRNNDSVYIYFEEKAYVPHKNHQVLLQTKGIITHSYQISDYYIPKIMSNGQIVGTLSIHALSNSWETGVAFSNDKIYSPQNYFYQQPVENRSGKPGMLYMSPADVQSIPFSLPHYWVDFRNITEFDASLDHFSFHTRLKSFIEECGKAINLIHIFLIGENDLQLRVPFLPEETFENAVLEVSELTINGEFEDLSTFGRNLSEWRKVEIRTKGKVFEILFDGNVIYRCKYQNLMGRIKGVVFRIKGCIGIDYVEIRNNENKTIFRDDFD